MANDKVKKEQKGANGSGNNSSNHATMSGSKDVDSTAKQDYSGMVNEQNRRVLSRIAMIKKAASGMAPYDITVDDNDLEEAYELYSKCKDDNLSPEVNSLVMMAGSKLGDFYKADLEKTDPEKRSKSFKVSDEMSRLYEDFNLSMNEWGVLKQKFVTNEVEYKSYMANICYSRAVTKQYGLPEGTTSLSKEDQRSLLNGGFLATAVDRKPCLVYNSYAYKLMNTPKDKRPTRYDPEFAQTCGIEYLNFVKSNPMLAPVEVESKGKIRRIDKPIANKGVMAESARKQGEFYRKWGEILAETKLEDLFDVSKYNDPKVMDNLLYISQSTIEFSQNSERIRGESELKPFFMQGFGGEEYYENLTGLVGRLQGIGYAATTYTNPESFPFQRAIALAYLNKCKEMCGPISGKNALEIAPDYASVERYNSFLSENLSFFMTLPAKEVEDFLREGKMTEDMKKQIDKGFEVSKADLDPKRETYHKAVKEQLASGKEPSLVDFKLTQPPTTLESKGKRNPFEGIDINTKFSPELKAKLLELKKEKQALEEVTENFLKSHPDAKINDFQDGIDKGAGSVKKDFDERNFAEYASVLFEPGWTLDEKKAFTNEFMERFYSSKEERYKLLGKVYDKFDSFSSENYDLTCISGNGKDKGERGADGLTPSERDLISYYRMNKAEQAFRTTKYGFNDFFQERYGTVQSQLEYEAKEQELRTPGNVMSFVFQGNGLGYSEFQERPEVEFEDGEELNGCAIGTMIGVCDMQKKLISGEIEPKDSNLVVNFGLEKPTERVKLNVLSAELQNTSSITSLGSAIEETYDFKTRDNVYIDGIRAEEYVQPFLKEGELPTNLLDTIITSGEHRIEVVSYGINKEGNITPIIATINPYNNEFYKKDPGREGRVEKIRNDVNNRLGPNKKFYDVLDNSHFSMNKDKFYEDAKNYKNKTVPPKEQTYEENIAKLKNELKAIDTWYHRNSKEYNNMLKSMDDPSNSKAMIEAAEAYINKYVKQDKTFQRQTDLGNARMSKIMEIKCAVKDHEREKDKKVLEGISQRKRERQNLEKDTTNIKVMIKESGVKERDWGKTKQVEKTLDKMEPQLNGPNPTK